MKEKTKFFKIIIYELKQFWKYDSINQSRGFKLESRMKLELTFSSNRTFRSKRIIVQPALRPKPLNDRSDLRI